MQAAWGGPWWGAARAPMPRAGCEASGGEGKSSKVCEGNTGKA